MTPPREYKAVDPTEQARIYRDRLRSLELEHVQKSAAKLAGDDVPDNVIEELEGRMDALESAAEAAESAGAPA